MAATSPAGTKPRVDIDVAVRAAHDAVLDYTSNGVSEDPAKLRSHLAHTVASYWANDDAAWVVTRRLLPYALRYGEDLRRTPERWSLGDASAVAAAATAYLLVKGLYASLRKPEG